MTVEQQKRQHLARATLVVAALFVASRLLGLLRDILIAARFGTSPDYDAYVAAFRIPDLIFLVVMSGAFGSAFIPVYAELLTKGQRHSAWRLANTLLSMTVAMFLLASLTVLITADSLIGTLVAPGLSPESRALAADLTRLLMLSPLCLGIGAAAKAMLESESRFTEPAVAPLLYNLGIIAGTVALAPFAGVYGLAIGVIVGAAGYAALQLWALYRTGWQFRLSFDRSVTGLRDVLSLLGPRLLAQAAMQANLLITTNLASRIGHQYIASLQYAYQIFLLPHGIFALSVATVLFPTLTRYRSAGDYHQLQRTVGQTLRVLVLITIPMTVLFGGFSRSIVQTLFQFGAFTATSTYLVSEALRWFAPGLLAYAIVELLTRLSYAFKDSRSPVIAALVAVGTNLVLSLTLIGVLGHRGLALSLALATTVEMVVLGLLVHRRVRLNLSETLRGLARALPALATLTIATLWFATPLALATDPMRGRSFAQFFAFGYTVAAVLAAYVLIALVFGQPDITRLAATFKRMLRRPMRQIVAAILGR